MGVVFRVQGPGSRVRGVGFRVQSAEFRVQGSWFGVWGVGCRAQGPGSGSRIQGSGFGVWGVRLTTRVIVDTESKCVLRADRERGGGGVYGRRGDKG